MSNQSDAEFPPILIICISTIYKGCMGGFLWPTDKKKIKNSPYFKDEEDDSDIFFQKKLH